VSGATISAAGEMSLYGSAVGTVLSSGYMIIYGGNAASTTIDSGGILEFGFNGTSATVNGVTINSSGALEAGSALITGAVINSGGVENLEGLSTDNGAIVSGGGYQIVNQYDTANATRVLSSGAQYVGFVGIEFYPPYFATGASIGGTASGAVLSGGTQFLEDAGESIAAIISSGGTEIVFGSTYSIGTASGGTASATTILSGGIQIVSSGGRPSARSSPAASKTSQASRVARSSSATAPSSCRPPGRWAAPLSSMGACWCCLPVPPAPASYLRTPRRCRSAAPRFRPVWSSAASRLAMPSILPRSPSAAAAPPACPAAC
jgi:autotransporter passenger strand-loop-strand repeat protein